MACAMDLNSIIHFSMKYKNKSKRDRHDCLSLLLGVHFVIPDLAQAGQGQYASQRFTAVAIYLFGSVGAI